MFALSETHEMLRKTCREFADKELVPIAGELDRHHRYPAEQVARLAEMGLMGVAVPEEEGGTGPRQFRLRHRHGRDQPWLRFHRRGHECKQLPVLRPGVEVCDTGAKEDFSAALCGRQAARLLRPERARQRLRCRGGAHHGRPARRPLGAQRHQGVDHQRLRSQCGHRVRHHRSRQEAQGHQRLCGADAEPRDCRWGRRRTSSASAPLRPAT